METDISNKQLRSFGVTVGGIFAVIGLWPVFFRGDDPRWWAVVIAIFLVLPALVFPASLFWIHKGWMFLGHVLG
jgi:hypothetical protein